ncbi:MAG: hypothetical protein ACFFB3_14490 [Candidatus Hodarchaeota archaeon]
MTDFSETLDLAHLKSQVDKVLQLLNVNNIKGFYISTPFSKGYRRTEVTSQDNFNDAIVEAILFLIREHGQDSSFDKVNIEDQKYNPLLEVTLFPSEVELKDLRKNEPSQKYKIILQAPD